MDDLERSGEDRSPQYHIDLARAYVVGMIGIEARGISNAEVVRRGAAAGLKLHRFKRSSLMPRVRRVLGTLRSFAPESLLDIGSGRGAFLWPLLDAFPELPVTALDQLDFRAADLQAVARGGIERLHPVHGDVCALPFANASFDGACILEVLEHLKNPLNAACEVLRVARRFAIASVPSKPDDNPEHLHLFSDRSLAELFESAAEQIGRSIRVRTEHVLNHIIAVITID